MAHGTLVRATTDKGGPGVESQVQMNVRLEITSRMPSFFSKPLIRDMARMVYMLVSGCFRHDEAELLLHNF